MSVHALPMVTMFHKLQPIPGNHRHQMIAETGIRKESGSFNTWKHVHLWLLWMRHSSALVSSLHRRCRVTQCCRDCSAPPLNISTSKMCQNRERGPQSQPRSLRSHRSSTWTGWSLSQSCCNTKCQPARQVRPVPLVSTCLITPRTVTAGPPRAAEATTEVAASLLCRNACCGEWLFAL